MRGFWIVGGFSYPGGGVIFHDPLFNVRVVNIEVKASSPDANQEGDDDPDNNGDGISGGMKPAVKIMIAVVIVIIIISIIIMIRRAGKKKDENPKDLDEPIEY